MGAFLTSFFMVVLAEMGDKTQLLAMAMAARFRPWKVMAGVLIATVLNHGLAVVVGTYLAAVIPLQAVSIAAGLSFVVFGLWTLRGDTLGDEAKRQNRFGPVVTVSIAFFLAEMGDKTQLATVALAADYRSPVLVLMGTTVGMAVADGLAVLVGDLIARRVSQQLMKTICAFIFMVFGFGLLYRTLGTGMIALGAIALLALVTIVASVWLVRQSHTEPDRKTA